MTGVPNIVLFKRIFIEPAFTLALLSFGASAQPNVSNIDIMERRLIGNWVFSHVGIVESELKMCNLGNLNTSGQSVSYYVSSVGSMMVTFTDPLKDYASFELEIGVRYDDGVRYYQAKSGGTGFSIQFSKPGDLISFMKPTFGTERLSLEQGNMPLMSFEMVGVRPASKVFIECANGLFGH